jgi:hypothetical protein
MGIDSISKAGIIARIFQGADAAGIPYCILRNYSDLPNSTLGGDIDLLCPPNMSIKWREYLQSVVSLHNLEIGVIQIHYHGIRYCLSSIERSFFLKLDIHYGEYWRGVQFMDAAQLLDSSVYYNGYRVIGPGHEAVLSLLAPLITGGKVRCRYKDVIANSVSQNRDEFFGVLQEILGLSTASDVVYLITEGRYDEISTLTARVRRQLWFRMLFKSRGRDLINVYRYLVYEFKRRTDLLGYLLVVAGEHDKIEKFLTILTNKTEADFPGLDMNTDCVGTLYRSFPSPCVSLRSLLQSYNVVVCSSGYYEAGHLVLENKIMLYVKCDKVVIDNMEYSYEEAMRRIYGNIMAIYSSTFARLSNK